MDDLAERIRQTLASREKSKVVNPDLKPSAVLLLLYQKQGAYHILFTKRTSRVDDHKGEVSFPGGAFHHGKDASLLETALRESMEEVGLDLANVDVLGELDEAQTRSGYHISSYVGILRQEQQFHPSAIEVAEILEVPLNTLLDPATLIDGSQNPTVYAGREITGMY